MPYNNAYNQMVARQALGMYINRVNHDNACNDNTRTNDVMSPLEGMALMKEDVVGGNGTVAATLHDLGYEVTNGTNGESEVRPRRGKGLSAGGVSAGGVSAGAMCGEGKPKRKASERAELVRKVMREHRLTLGQASKYVKEHGMHTSKKKGGALLSLANLDDMKGNQDPQTFATGGVQKI